MADAFSQLYIQIIFVVKFRKALIDASWEENLYKYITGIIQGRGHKLLAINGMPDHIHIFIGMKPSEALSELVREIKISSQSYIIQNKFTEHYFRWQPGYGAFSYSRSHIDRVCNYIGRQKQHHSKKTFKQEFLSLLRKYEIDIGRKEIFDFLDILKI